MSLPKRRCNGTMTESQFLAWVRSALRSKSLRWPPRNTCLELARRPYKGPNKRQKWEYECAICKNYFNAKEVAVDHYPKEAGSILSVADVGEFVNNLYCEVDNLRCLCKECHDIHTLASKNGITFKEARIEKEILAIMKWPKKKIDSYCEEHGYSGTTNDVKRKAAVSAILKGE